MLRLLFGFILLSFQFAAASDLAEKLMADYKIKKKSTLKICQQKPYLYARFYKTIDDDGHSVIENYSMRVSSDRKEADAFDKKEDTRGFPPYPVDVKDINRDGLRDILVSHGGCGSSSDCMYDVLVYCGQGKYKSLINEVGESLNSPRFSSKTVPIDGVL